MHHFASSLPVQLIQQQQVAVEIAHQAQVARIFIEFFQHNFCRFKFTEQDLRTGNVTPLTLQEVVVGKLRFRRMTQPVGGRILSPTICQ